MRETHMHDFYDEQFEDGSVGFTCQTCDYFFHFEPRVKGFKLRMRKPFPYDDLVKEVYAERIYNMLAEEAARELRVAMGNAIKEGYEKDG